MFISWEIHSLWSLSKVLDNLLVALDLVTSASLLPTNGLVLSFSSIQNIMPSLKGNLARKVVFRGSGTKTSPEVREHKDLSIFLEPGVGKLKDSKTQMGITIDSLA